MMTTTVPNSTAVYPDLAGKTAVVTGGSRGIGADVAKALAANGVAVAGRDHEALGSVVKTIGAGGGRAVAVAADFLPDLTSRTGAIVTMSSSAGRQATGASAAYAAAKAGVIGLSRHLAGELAGAGSGLTAWPRPPLRTTECAST